MAKVVFRYEKKVMDFRRGEILGEGRWKVVKDSYLFKQLGKIAEASGEKGFEFKFKIKPDRDNDDRGVMVIKSRRTTRDVQRVTKMQIVEGISLYFEECLDLSWR